MSYYRDIWRIINAEKTSTGRTKDGGLIINNGSSFRGLSIRAQKKVSDIVEEKQRELITDMSSTPFITAADARARSEQTAASILTYGADKKPLVQRVKDSFGFPDYSGSTALGGASAGTYSTSPVWISAGEAATIFGQQGIPTLIIKKKSSSINLNGVRIKNPKIDQSRMDTVNESAIRTGLAPALSDATRDGLVYGGALLYPMFNDDSPATMSMSISMLAKYNIVKKNCISRYVSLDKNAVVFIPNWNPTAEDFLCPKYYYIPFMGGDVHGSRCARIVPLPQAGYWGALMSMGWGMSDITGWYQSALNYERVTQAVPKMIDQMSLLVRSFNMDLANALNGAASLTDLDTSNTLAVREASNDNPISMDVIGELKAIDRDFAEVPALYRLVRQDLAAKGSVAEETLWSSEKGAFASGNSGDSADERVWENVRYVQRDVSNRCKNLAMLEIINALGKDRDIIDALPYTTIEFDSPVTSNALKRSEVYANVSKGLFDTVASGVPANVALAISSAYGDDHFMPKINILEDLKMRQDIQDKRAEEKHRAEMDLLKAQIENAKNPPAPGAGTGDSKLPAKASKGEGYSRLEQHQKERSRGTGARREAIQKAEGKKI